MKPLNRVCFTLLVPSLFFFAACSNNPPRLYQVWWLPVLSQEEGRELILYVHVDDPDGEGDTAEIRLIRDDAQYEWVLTPDEWSRWEKDGEVWLGSSRFSGGREELQRGEYRLEVEDKGGRVSEMALYLEGWPDGERLLESAPQRDESGLWRVNSDRGDWFLLKGEGDIQACPQNRSFNPQSLAGEGEFFLILYDRTEMAELRWGPFSS